MIIFKISINYFNIQLVDSNLTNNNIKWIIVNYHKNKGLFIISTFNIINTNISGTSNNCL